MNWYKSAQNQEFVALIASFFKNELELDYLIHFIINKNINPQDVQSYIQRMEGQLVALNPQMYYDKKERLFRAINGANYNYNTQDTPAETPMAPEQEALDVRQDDPAYLEGGEE